MLQRYELFYNAPCTFPLQNGIIILNNAKTPPRRRHYLRNIFPERGHDAAKKGKDIKANLKHC